MNIPGKTDLKIEYKIHFELRKQSLSQTLEEEDVLFTWGKNKMSVI